MTIKFKDDIIERALAEYGKEYEIIVALEELAELVQCLTKKLRNMDNTRHHITEEIADVLIGIEYVKRVYDISESEMQMWVDYKLRRLTERMDDKTETKKED